jgi:predicted DNA-binding transcriptional regulator YafY
VISDRVVEPVGYIGADNHWYLVAWCRLRAAFRCFRLDRVLTARQTGEVAVDRGFDPADLDLSGDFVTRLTVGVG